MTDTKVEFNSVDFKKLLNVKARTGGGTIFFASDESTKRQLAVVAALELIKADVSSSYANGGTATKSSYALESHMKNLSDYADCIVQAMAGTKEG